MLLASVTGDWKTVQTDSKAMGRQSQHVHSHCMTGGAVRQEGTASGAGEGEEEDNRGRQRNLATVQHQ